MVVISEEEIKESITTVEASEKWLEEKIKEQENKKPFENPGFY